MFYKTSSNCVPSTRRGNQWVTIRMCASDLPTMQRDELWLNLFPNHPFLTSVLFLFVDKKVIIIFVIKTVFFLVYSLIFVKKMLIKKMKIIFQLNEHCTVGSERVCDVRWILVQSGNVSSGVNGWQAVNLLLDWTHYHPETTERRK